MKVKTSAIVALTYSAASVAPGHKASITACLGGSSKADPGDPLF